MSDFQSALNQLDQAAVQLFQTASVRSVGVAKIGDGYGYEVVKNSRVIEPFAAEPAALLGLPVRFKKTPGDVLAATLKIPHSLLSGMTTTFIPETQTTRPLFCGLQIQNYEADVRDGTVSSGYIKIGTLSCFVRTSSGEIALLSNNHVVAQQNHGLVGDRIVQACAINEAEAVQNAIAHLSNFIPITPSAAGATVGSPGFHPNRVDAGCAILTQGHAPNQQSLPSRPVPAIRGTGAAVLGQSVFKVGRTTGLTWGTVTSVATTVGPVGYTDGPSWFQGSFVVEGVNGTLFSDHGDSGSAVLAPDGTILGLLYAGNGTQTYVCPIAEVLNLLQCQLL